MFLSELRGCAAGAPLLRRLLTVALMLACVLASWATLPALAHQQRAALTQVLFNPRTGNLEVAHRFYLHDAEHAMGRILHPAADIIHDPEVQREFAEYVTERFSIRVAGATDPLPLTLLGWEDERAYIWVYQEIKAPLGVDGLVIDHRALRDLWYDQLNTVNIEGRGALRTLTFTRDDGAKAVQFINS